MKYIGVLLLAATALGGSIGFGAEDPRPNFLWLIAEDFGPDLGCYGEPLVTTPHLDRLAREGVRFTAAFVTGPVCSASRSAFMTGMYQTTIDAQNHRSHRSDGRRLPAGVAVVTEYFRRAGYFTANVRTAAPGVTGTGKTDFNFQVDQPFDGTDWNQRREGQPFFAQVNFQETHRAFPKVTENKVDPAKVKLPPYYPDHPTARADWAMYLDAANQLDRKIGAVLKRLEDEGLSQSTIVFFFGDNGQCHVRGKQWLYEGGIHVPLLIRVPERFRAAGVQPGSVRDDLVSAIDFAPTCMALAGIALPEKMEGRSFLGPGARGRDFIVAARDRCDETVDRIRCVRTKQYKYIRNFYPERPYTQPNAYKERSYPVLNLMKELHAEGKLTPAQSLFMAPRRPVEELYDFSTDADELKNLAESPDHRQVLADLRGKLDGWIAQTGDQGQFAEDQETIRRAQEQPKAPKKIRKVKKTASKP